MERNWTEAAVEMFAAAALGASVAFATTLLGAGVAGAALGGICFAVTLAAMRRLPVQGGWRLPEFDLAEVPESDPAGWPELLLTECDRLDQSHVASATSAIAEELLLDDALELPSGDSRVVQLFGPRPMPTPGEAQAKIVRHLQQRGSPPVPADAAAALSEALAELRRSLR